MVILNPVHNDLQSSTTDNVLVVKKKNKRRKNFKGTIENECMNEKRFLLYKIAICLQWRCPYDGVFISQPYLEEYAVCAVVCAGHILDKRLSIEKNSVNDGRWQFEMIAKSFGDIGWHNANGHYHVDVLNTFLHNNNTYFIAVKLYKQLCFDRIKELYDMLCGINENNVYFFMGTIVLTSKCTVAHRHYVCVRTYSNTRPVLLDGLYSGPVLFCMETLLRYTQIDKLYRVFDRK
jgi:hypothetical protein